VPPNERLRRHYGHCPECGYDLSAGTADVCPECAFDVVAQARDDLARGQLPEYRRNPMASVVIAGIVPSFLFAPLSLFLSWNGPAACAVFPLLLIITIVLLTAWARRLNEVGKGSAETFRRAAPRYLAAAWAWPVLLLALPWIGAVWRLLVR
jgi:hypothetical protein